MKNILITGSTDGIGKLLAHKLASEGHSVIVHGRNPQKVSQLIKDLKDQTGNSEIKGYGSDFSDLDSVIRMASKITKDQKQIDILINNAGVFVSKIQHTKAGMDIRFCVNYLAPFLLTTQLLPLLEQSRAKVINLSSAAQSEVSHPALKGLMELTVRESYAQSKLALTMWSFHLAESHPRLCVIAVNPGSLLNTKMAKEAYGQHWASAEKGVNILYDLALSPEFNDGSGKYYDNDRNGFGKAHPDAYNRSKIKKLIMLTETMFIEHDL